MFFNVASGGRLNTSDNSGSFLVNYSGNNIILSNFLASGSVIPATWTGGNGNWSTGSNWNINPNFPNNGQPGAGDRYDATLANGGTIALDIPITIQKFTLSAGIVIGANNLTLNDLFHLERRHAGGQRVFNANGGISMAGGSQLNLNGATLNNPVGQTVTDSGFHDFGVSGGAIINNGGTWLAQGDLGMNFGNGGTFNNTGTFTRNTGTGTYALHNALAFNNSGTVNVQSGTLAFHGGYTQTAGTLNLAGGNVSSGSALQVQGGLLTGFGTLNAALSNNAMLRPGLAAGGLAVNGNVSLLGASQLIFNLGGLTQGSQYRFPEREWHGHARRAARALVRERLPEYCHRREHVHASQFEQCLHRRLCQHRFRQPPADERWLRFLPRDLQREQSRPE